MVEGSAAPRPFEGSASAERTIERVSSSVTGVLEIERGGWKSDGVVLISLSQFREEQEAMLLVPIHGWIRGSLGRFDAEPSADCPWRASLELKG